MRLLITEMHEEWKALSVPLPPPGDLSQRTLAPRYAMTHYPCIVLTVGEMYAVSLEFCM